MQKRTNYDTMTRTQNTSNVVLLKKTKEILSLALKMTSTYGWKMRAGSVTC